MGPRPGVVFNTSWNMGPRPSVVFNTSWNMGPRPGVVFNTSWKILLKSNSNTFFTCWND